MTEQEKGNQRITSAIGMPVDNFHKHHNGISFTVQGELNAYKAAYYYRYCKSTVVSKAPNLVVPNATEDTYLIQVYTQ